MTLLFIITKEQRGLLLIIGLLLIFALITHLEGRRHK